jgi:integrase
VPTITRTKSGTWKALVRKVGWPTTIKTFRTKKDAEDWARRVEDEIVRGAFIVRAPSERMTVEEALKRYLAEVTPTKKPSTQAGEEAKAKQLRKALGKYALAAVTPDLVAGFRDRQLAAGKANNTVRLELALLGHLFTMAMKEWRVGLTYNPVHAIRKPSPGRGRDRRLSDEEELQLLKACDAHSNPMFGWIVRIALETGMRSSEIASLRRSHVDLKKRIVRLADTKNNSARSVPLSRGAAQLFRDALNNPVRVLDSDLLFPGEPGRDGARRPYAFTKQWMDTKRNLKMTDLRFHDLRHEAVSRLVESGLSDQEVAAISGQKSMQMLKRYTHLRAEDLVARIDEARSRARPNQ